MSTHSIEWYWLVFAHAYVKLTRWRERVSHFESLEALCAASKKALQAAGFSQVEIQSLLYPDEAAITRMLNWCEAEHCHIIYWGHPYYPKLLAEISDPPPVLFVQGNPDVLTMPQLAMVGTRNPTACGSESAQHFARSLTGAGLVITSGLALGIDGASHKGALSGAGKSIAVIGSGLQHIYPFKHKRLAAELMLHGAVVSEFLPNTPPMARNFPLRNRIISGMSLGVVVVEAAIRSGSLITARLAAEQGREVFAMPGSIHNPVAKGCHLLLRNGAKLVEKASDILEELGPLYAALTISTVSSGAEVLDLADKERDFLNHVDYHTTDLNAIIQRSGLTAGEVSSMLLALELRGYVHFSAGGYMRKTS